MNEEQYVNKIEEFLKDNGFQTWREVIPDECKKWKNPYRVDLIFFRKDLGYTAVEAKYIRSLRQGGVIAKAVKQIQKYRCLSFLDGLEINRWCILVNNYLISNDLLVFLRHFLNAMYSIQLVSYYEHPRNPEWNCLSINSMIKEAVHIKKKRENYSYD